MVYPQVMRVDWMQEQKEVVLEDARKPIRCVDTQKRELSFLTQTTATNLLSVLVFFLGMLTSY